MTPERLRELANKVAIGFVPRSPQLKVDMSEALREYAAMLEAKAPPEATGIYESGWVIEGMWSSTASPEYWVGSSAWSSDPYKALRFASKQSAQQAADMMLVGINHRVACHEFAGNSHHE